MRSFGLAIFSAFAALASARTTPDYSLAPEGNPILLPGLNEQVPIGSPYTITWTPTTSGTVSLVLLRGPSTNVLPLETLVEGIPNSGTYSWTPAADLEVDTTHYGLLLVVDATGEYQYSTQFGVSNPDHVEPSVTTTTAAPTTTTAPATESGVSYSTYVPTTVITKTHCNCQSSSVPIPASSSLPHTSKPVIPPTSVPTFTSVNPTASSTTTPSAPIFTGAAGHNIISYGAVAAGIVAALAF